MKMLDKTSMLIEHNKHAFFLHKAQIPINYSFYGCYVANCSKNKLNHLII